MADQNVFSTRDILDQTAATGLTLAAQGSAQGGLTGKDYAEKAMRAVVARDYGEARNILDQGVARYPEDIDLIRLSGDLYLRDGDRNKALMSYMAGMKINPLDTQTLCSMGGLLVDMGNLSSAKGFYMAAHRTDPTDAFAAYSWIYASMFESDWTFFEKLPELLRLGDDAPLDVQPYALLAVFDDPALHKRRVEARSRALMQTVQENAVFQRSSVKGRKIRIGFFSNDFYVHATMLLLGRFFDLIDRDRFEVVIYDFGTAEDNQIREGVEGAADIYRQVSALSDHELVQLARQDGIDIAVDMKTHTKGGRIAVFAERAAPVQVSFLGYPASSGLPSMDYFVADAVTVPPSLQKHFSEKLIYMPDCYQVNDNTRPHPETLPTRADYGLPDQGIVFCSLNNPNKVTPAEFDVWMKLLRDVPDSVLWIMAPEEVLQQNLLAEAAARGVGADRLVFAGRLSVEEHHARMGVADIFLDAFNCNAHTTASEAVWSGVPVITKAGQQFAARVAASVVTAIGCPDLVTETEEDYYQLAYNLATDPEALSRMKQRLKDNLWTTPLYDSEAYVRNFEALMEKAILRYEDGLKPDHLSLT